jgi:hypothetical protein
MKPTSARPPARLVHLGSLLAIGWAVAASGNAIAQSAEADLLEQKVGLRSAVPPPAAATETDSDLGDISAVQRYPKPDMLTLTAQQEFFYTDNVYFTHRHPEGASAYLGSYSGIFVPYSLRDWTPRVTLQYNMVRYAGVYPANFDNEDLGFSSQYIFGGDRSWTWTAAINLARYTPAVRNSDQEFYREVVYHNQVAHTQRLSAEVPLFLVTAYDLSYHQANPTQFDRIDNTLSCNLTYKPLADVSISAFVRPSYRIYPTDTDPLVRYPNFFFGPNSHNAPPQHDRADFNISAGIDVTWTPIKYLSVSADFDAVRDYSNNSALSYDQSSPGVSLTGSYRF